MGLIVMRLEELGWPRNSVNFRFGQIGLSDMGMSSPRVRLPAQRHWSAARVASRHDLFREFFQCHGATLTRSKFLLRLLNVLDKFFPSPLDNTTMQNLFENFLIFQR